MDQDLDGQTVLHIAASHDFLDIAGLYATGYPSVPSLSLSRKLSSCYAAGIPSTGPMPTARPPFTSHHRMGTTKWSRSAPLARPAVRPPLTLLAASARQRGRRRADRPRRQHCAPLVRPLLFTPFLSPTDSAAAPRHGATSAASSSSSSATAPSTPRTTSASPPPTTPFPSPSRRPSTNPERPTTRPRSSSNGPSRGRSGTRRARRPGRRARTRSRRPQTATSLLTGA